MTAIAVERTRVDLRPLAWAVLLAAGLFVLDIGGWYGYINDQPSRIATQIATYVVIGGWLLVAGLRPAWLPRTPLARPVTAVAAVFALSGLLSQRSRLSTEATLAGLAVAAIFLLVSRLASEPWFRTRLRVILVGAPIAVATAATDQNRSPRWIMRGLRRRAFRRRAGAPNGHADSWRFRRPTAAPACA